MGIRFFQNGSDIGSQAGWGGWTGNNNYVIRYDFQTPAAGATAVSIELRDIFSGKNQGSQDWGFKISRSSTAFANARNEEPDSNRGRMVYSDSIGWYCTLTATGLNLEPDTSYYLFVYVCSGGSEYYQGWNCLNPTISITGAFTPSGSSLLSISQEVLTGENVSIIMKNPGGLTHWAIFKAYGNILHESNPFQNSLDLSCPREWMEANFWAEQIQIDVEIQSSDGKTINTKFLLTADAGMKPILNAGAAWAEPINPPDAPADIGFLAGISKAHVEFDDSKIDLSNCAGAWISYREIRWAGKKVEAAPYDTNVLSSDTKITIVVTDSRGRQASAVINVKMTPYVAPSINNPGAKRCGSDGIDSVNGEYYKVIGTTVFTPLDGKNSVSIFASIKATGQDYSGETELSGWENGLWSDNWAAPSILGGSLYGDSYTVKLRITDRVGGSSEVTARLYRQEWLLKANSTGTALGIGMAPTGSNSLELPEEWKILIGGVDIAEAIASKILGKLYQVGDYFISENADTDPSVRFGGTWERVKDRYLKDAGDRAPGTQGGNANHSHTTGDFALTMEHIPPHQHQVYYKNFSMLDDSNSGNATYSNVENREGTSTPSSIEGQGLPHNHGSTDTASNDPPYRLVYIWRKTA